MAERTFTVILEPDLEEGGYTVLVPALPGCVSEGDSVEQALVKAKDAIRVCLEDMLEYGEWVPEGRPAVEIRTVTVEAWQTRPARTGKDIRTELDKHSPRARPDPRDLGGRHGKRPNGARAPAAR